ncbi:MAG: acetate/propionate family kinase [Candidatus Latescibacterota bacterium]
MDESMRILVANVGSTSFKYKLYDMTSETILASGRIERVGSDQAPFSHQALGKAPIQGTTSIPDYPTAVSKAVAWITDEVHGAVSDLSGISAVGFKTVHLKDKPGAYLLTDEILEKMAEYNDLVPLHNPPYIKAIGIFQKLFPGLPLVGLFEPAFHAGIPDYAYIYGVPYAWYEKYGVRKVGFHGASHRYVSERVPECLGVSPKGLKLVSCHLGGSSSLCAIQDGRSVDTSMGFGAQDGIINAARNGDLDVFAVLHVMDREGLSTEDVRTILSRESGLLGISGISEDMRDLELAMAAGNDRARLAIAAFCYGVKKTIGAYAAAMGGLDAIAFAGGIGEKGPIERTMICEGLEFLGVRLDEERNRSCKGEGLISSEDSRVKILVIQTNEEIIVARETARVVSEKSRS